MYSSKCSTVQIITDLCAGSAPSRLNLSTMMTQPFHGAPAGMLSPFSRMKLHKTELGGYLVVVVVIIRPSNYCDC